MEENINQASSNVNPQGSSSIPTQTPQPPTPPNPQNSNINYLKTISIGMSIVSFCIGIAVIGYLFASSKNKTSQVSTPKVTSTPKPTTIPTVDPTVSWKTYTNSQYGFSIKYPPSYVCGFSMQNYYDTPHSLNKPVGVFGCSEGELKMTGGVTGDSVTLVIYPKDFEPIYQFSEDRGDTIILADQKVPKRYGLNETIIDFGPIIHNEKTYVFEYDEPYVPNGRADQTNLNLFLSTFKFTDQTSDLSKIYTGKGFSFQIPVGYSTLTTLDNKVEFIITDHGIGLTTLKSQNIPFPEPTPQPDSNLHTGTKVEKTAIQLDKKQTYKYIVTSSQTELSTDEIVFFDTSGTYYELDTHVDGGGISIDKFISTFKFTN